MMATKATAGTDTASSPARERAERGTGEGTLPPSSFAAKALFLRCCCRNPHSIDDSVTIAVASSNPLAIRFLGVNTRSPGSNAEYHDEDEEDLETALHSAIRYGASDRVLRALIELDSCHDGRDSIPAVATADGSNGDLPLHTAIRHEASPSIVQLLLESFPSSLVVGNLDSETPLSIASRCQRYDLVTLLLGQAARMPGGNVMLKEVLTQHKDRWNCNPMEALWYSYLDNENEEDERLQTAAHRRRHCRGLKNSLVVTALGRMYVKTDSCTGFVSQHQIGDENDDVEPYEVVESMIQLVAAASGERSVQDTSQLVRSILYLGPDICPPSFLSVVLRGCPEVLRVANEEGQVPLHVAAALGKGGRNSCTRKNTRGKLNNLECWQDSFVTMSTEDSDAVKSSDASFNQRAVQETYPHLVHCFGEEEDEDILALSEVRHGDVDLAIRENPQGQLRSRSRSPLSPWELFGGEDDRERDFLEATHKPSHSLLSTRNAAGSSDSTTVAAPRENEYDDDKTTMLQIVLDADPSCARLFDSKGRLPFHMALGMPWGPTMKQLFRAYPEAICKVDPVTGLYPFMTAAAAVSNVAREEREEECKLQIDDDDDNASLPTAVFDSSYQLLRQSPSILLSYLSSRTTSRKRHSEKSPSCSSCDMRNKKRRLCP